MTKKQKLELTRIGKESLKVKKIPKQVLSRCKWGHDGYSLQVENLPKESPKPGQQSLFYGEV